MRAPTFAAAADGRAAGASSLQAQQYPQRPITMIVPVRGRRADRRAGARARPADGAPTLGQSIVIEDVTGAGGTIGAAQVPPRRRRRLHAGDGQHRHPRGEHRPLQEPVLRSAHRLRAGHAGRHHADGAASPRRTCRSRRCEDVIALAKQRRLSMGRRRHRLDRRISPRCCSRGLSPCRRAARAVSRAVAGDERPARRPDRDHVRPGDRVDPHIPVPREREADRRRPRRRAPRRLPPSVPTSTEAGLPELADARPGPRSFAPQGQRRSRSSIALNAAVDSAHAAMPADRQAPRRARRRSAAARRRAHARRRSRKLVRCRGRQMGAADPRGRRAPRNTAMRLTDEEAGDAGRRVRPGRAMGDRAPDQGRRAISAPRISCRWRRPTSWPTPSRSASPASNGSSAGRALPRRAAARAHPDHHRSARHRLRGRAQAQAAAVDARPRAPRHRGLRGARRADDRHLHQLPDHHAAGARRARRLWRHRRGDLFQQRVRRALELRGRAVGAERRAHRPHAALRLSSRRAPARRRCSSQVELHAARAQRLGRARRHRRPARRRLLAGAGAGRASTACPAPTR